MKAFLISFLSIGLALAARGASAPLPVGSRVRSEIITNGFEVTEEFYAVVNGQTNPAVTERVVGPLLPARLSPARAIFQRDEGSTCRSLNTNQNCYLNGRLFRVDFGIRKFYVTPSAPFGTTVFTPEGALRWDAGLSSEPG